MSLAWTSDVNQSQLLCELVVLVYLLVSLRQVFLSELVFFFLLFLSFYLLFYPASLSFLPLGIYSVRLALSLLCGLPAAAL